MRVVVVASSNIEIARAFARHFDDVRAYQQVAATACGCTCVAVPVADFAAEVADLRRWRQAVDEWRPFKHTGFAPPRSLARRPHVDVAPPPAPPATVAWPAVLRAFRSAA